MQNREKNDYMEDHSIHNRKVTAVFESRVDGKLRFRCKLEEGEGKGETHTIWVDEPEFDPAQHYRTGERYDLLVESKVEDSDALDPDSKGWNGSLRKLEKLALWEKFEKLAEEHGELKGEIIGCNRGGLTIDLGIRAFAPMNQAFLLENDSPSVREINRLIGTSDVFEVIEFDPERANVVVSRRKSLEKRRKEEKKELLSSLEVGKRYTGVVSSVLDYGAFVDIGGLEGLLHASNVSWGRVDDVRKVYSEGDEVEVLVLDYEPDKKRISLGVKQLTENPWNTIDTRFREGQVVKGKVTSLAKFGAFVELEPAVEGMVHLTELSWKQSYTHPKQCLKVGEEVEVKILEIDKPKMRISLSIKQTSENPWDLFVLTHKEGEVLEGVITKIQRYGLFVELAEGVIGLLHESDLSWTVNYQLASLKEQGQGEEDDNSNEAEPFPYKEGDRLKVKILSIDREKERISLGLKQLTEDPWLVVEEKIKRGDKIDVEITRVTHFGAFAAVTPEIEGLIHISELSEERVEDPRLVVRPGQKVKATVLSVDPKEQRISLSLAKDVLEDDIPTSYDESSQASTSLGAVLKDQFESVGGMLANTPSSLEGTNERSQLADVSEEE